MKGSPPWIDIFTSLPFLAILVAHTAEGWGFGTMQTGLPKYLSEAMNFRLSKVCMTDRGVFGTLSKVYDEKQSL